MCTDFHPNIINICSISGITKTTQVGVGSDATLLTGI